MLTPDTARAPFPTVTIGGIPIHAARFDDALAFAEERIRTREPTQIFHVGAHGIVEAQDDPTLRAALLGATLAAADGMPLVWAGRCAGLPAERVYGPDVMRALLARTAQWQDRPCRHFLYGSTPEVLAALGRHIATAYPGTVVAGAISPPFRPLSEDEEVEMARRIDAAGTDVLWVGLGAPRQELWIARNRPRLRAPLMLGVGAAFDFLAGTKPQAPAWIRSGGLEWAYRLCTEPRRLAGRYGTIIPRFLGLLARQALRGWG